MLYRLLADAVILLHFLWVLFILFGILLARRNPFFLWSHLIGLAFTLVLNLGGWFCPLTDLENFLSAAYDPGAAYGGSFLARYLEKIIYLDVPEFYLRAGAVAWVAINAAGYACLFRRRAA
ncbi:MAG TPA: DUF2784 domain-containing protein [Thermodesulfobacteriota bacterium]|nr:DUF2784 domain-containing protein [Thermodesulfobacteriota bacterium]